MQTEETQKDETLGTRSEIETLGGCKRRMKATVPAGKVVEELDRNYEDLAKTVQIPGFRKGRVPRPLLESRYGEEIESEVKESIVAASFSEVIEEKELQVFSSPRFENVTFETDSDLTYEVEFEVRPEFELPEYRGVEVAAGSVELSEDEVAAELEKLREQMATVEPARPEDVGEGGYLSGSYTLFVDDNEVKHVNKFTFRPSTGVLEHFYVEELEKRLAEHDWSSEEPLAFDVNVPPEYPDEVLRGRDARLELTVEDGYDLKLPELDDELAKKAGKENLEELRTDLRETLRKRKEREVERGIEDAILDKLAEATEMDVPEALVEAQIRRNRASQEQVLLEQGFTPEQVREYFARKDAESASAESETSDSATDEESAADESGEEAEEAKTTDEIRLTAKKYFILEAIAEKEKIFVTEKDVDVKLADMAQHYGMPPEGLRAELEKSERLNELRLSLKHDKVREYLRSRAKTDGASTPAGPSGEAVAEAGASGGAVSGEAETVDET